MKRIAEKQLVKDSDVSDEEPEEETTTFKKADDSALAGRRIRGLPKRSVVAIAAANGSSTPELPSKPKFSGFAGFGAPSSNSAFTFIAPSTKPSSPTAQSPSEVEFQPVEMSSSPAAISSTATNTAKTLASFLGFPPESSTTQKSNSTGFATNLAFPFAKPSTTSAPFASTPVASTSSTPAEPNDSAVKYYTELRGLNVSLLAAVTKAIQDDTFVDVSQILEQYKNRRTKIQDDYDKLKEGETNKVEPSKPQTPPSMPAPPTSFSFGDKVLNLSSFKTSEPSNGSGFKPVVSATTNAIPSSFKLTSTAPSSSEPSNVGKPPSIASPFTFGTLATSDSTSSVFGNLSKPDLKFTAPSTTGSAGSPFGSSYVFGSSSNSSVFTQTTPATPGFGKPPGSGNIGNPVGFGFAAASAKGIDGVTGTKTSGFFSLGQPSSSPFGPFALAKEVKKSEEEGEGEEGSAGDSASAATEGDDVAAKMGRSGTSLHDVEGEGEEDEETTHSVKLKAYRLKKADEKGGEGWVELGVGFLRLKRHKETDARRVLLRNSATGKIGINFNLYSGLKVTLTKKSLTFIGHDTGVAQTYNVRLPNEDQARELKEAMERELALLKPREE